MVSLSRRWPASVPSFVVQVGSLAGAAFVKIISQKLAFSLRAILHGTALLACSV